MSIIYILIPIAILLTAIGIYLFFWAVKTEQFDDLEKQGMSILFNENNEEQQSNDKENQENNIKSDLNNDDSDLSQPSKESKE